MRIVLIAVCCLVGIVSAGMAQAPPIKVAYMYCSWPNAQAAFKDEFDEAFKALGWQVTKIENTQAKELSERLGEFDIVVGGGVSNYENPQDFSPYAAQWQAFLNRGGVVIATDASYGGINGQWIGGIDPALKTGSATCSAHTKPTAETIIARFTAGDPVLMAPHGLEPRLASKTNWAHLEDVGEGWAKPIVCYDDKPVLIHRAYGKGLVIVTSYFRFSGQSELAAHLPENALTLARMQQHGARLTQVSIRSGFHGLGENRLGLRVRNTGNAEARFALRLEARCGEQAIAPADGAVAIPAGQEALVALTFSLPVRGRYESTLTLNRNAEPILTLHPELVVPELLTVRLSRRHAFLPNPNMSVSMILAPELQEKLGRLRMTMQPIGAKPGLSVTVPAGAIGTTTDLSLAKLPPGKYGLLATLSEGQQKLAEVRLSFTLHPEPRVRFNSKNVCYIEGKPFFPLGMYHVAWQATKEQMLQCVEDLAAAGFNTVHTSCTNLDTYQEVLDRAQARGLHVIPEGIGANSPALARFKNHPAILAWNSGDEPDCYNVPPAQVLENIEAIRDGEATHPCYTTVANPNLLLQYAPSVEVFSNDPYPLTGAKMDTIAVANQTAQAREAVQHRKPIWMVPQCFGYAEGPWRVPTPAQERSMTYQALIEGANGLIWYTYDDRKFKVLEHPDLWAMMQRLTAEIKTLTPILLEPAHEAKRFQAGPEGCLRTCVIRDGKGLYILAAHTNDKDLGAQELTPPGLPAQGQAEVLFENRTVALTDGKLSDRFEPYAVHVYRVKL